MRDAHSEHERKSPLQAELLRDPVAAVHGFVATVNELAKGIHTEAEVEILDLRQTVGRAGVNSTVRSVRFGYSEMRMGPGYMEQLIRLLPLQIGERLKQQIVFDPLSLFAHVIEFSTLKNLLIRFIESAVTNADNDFLLQIRARLPAGRRTYRTHEVGTSSSSATGKKNGRRKSWREEPEYSFEPPPEPPQIQGWAEACREAERIGTSSARHIAPSSAELREQVDALFKRGPKQNAG